MRNKVKRTLSFLLTFVMLCSLLPAMAMAKEGKDDVWNNEYGSIRIYVDDYTWNEMKSLPGIGVNQVKIDADNYPEDDRGCSWMPGENYFYTTNPAVKVKATDINALILTKIAIDTKEIKIPMEGDETHTVTVSEGKFGADTPYLRIDIKERKEFKLIFDAGDGFFADGSQKQVVTLSSEKPEETYPVPQVTTEPENYRFSSWKNEEKGVLGKSELSYSEVKGLFEGKEKGELTYHAVYDELYQVSYTVSGDQPATFTPDIPGVTKYVKGEEVQVAAPLTTTETSYNGVNGQWVFNGWTTTDVEVNEGKFVMPQGDVTLTGSWTFTPNPVEEKKIIVNFNKVGGTWADGVTEDAKTFVLSSTTPTAEMDVPEVVAPAGKKLSHWENNWEKLTTLPENGIFTYNSMAAIVGTEQNELYITWNPVYEDIPVEKTLRIHWAIDDPEGATWADGSNAPKTETIAWADRGNTFVMPELNIKEGYKLAGWSVSGTEGQYWDPETYEFGLTGLIVEDETGGQVSITANVVKDEEPAGKTLRIHWAIDNPEGAAWKLYEGNARTETIAWADRGNTFVMPELEIKDGYKLAGWSVSGTEGQYWDPETYEFGLTGLIVEDENGGQVSITANVVKDEVSTEDKIANVYFTVNPKYGYFKKYGEGPVSFENIDADSTQQFEVPEVVAKSGYKFVGWEGKGAGEIKWDANASTFGVPGLCYFPEGSNVGRADIRAVFEKEGGGHINDYAVTVIVDGKGEVKTKDYGTVGSNDTDVIWIPDFVDSVKFTMEPADGWKIDDVLVNGKSIGAEDSYVFETEDLMDGPELKVIFEKKSSGGGGGGSHDKDDDKDKDKAPDKTPDALNGEDHFNYIVGDADGKVHPERNITRAEVASIFFRLLQDDVREKNLTDQNPFNDVFTDDWFNVAVSTMYDMDIVYGRDNNNFDPNAYITRAEFAAIAARFDSEGYSGENLFTDIDGHWAANQINRAAEKGWISGYPDGTFGPDRYITRAEAVTMINRVLNRLPESADALHEDMNVFPDNMDTTAWYYLAIQEATSSHEYEKDKDGVYETWTDVLPDRDWAQYLKLN